MFTFTGDGKEHQQSSTLVLTQLLPVLATASPNHGTQAHPPSSQATRGEGGQWKGLRLSGSPTDSPATRPQTQSSKIHFPRLPLP